MSCEQTDCRIWMSTLISRSLYRVRDTSDFYSSVGDVSTHILMSLVCNALVLNTGNLISSVDVNATL